MEFDYRKLAEEMLKQMPGNYTTVTLIEFTEQIISYTENNRAQKTVEGVKLICKKLLNFFPPTRRLDTIKLKDAENFLDSIKRNAPKGVYNYHRTLRAMWNKAKQWNYVKENPLENIKLSKRQNVSPTIVTEKQLEMIVMKVDSEIVRDGIITAFYTGCRLGELINLTWQEVNLRDDLLTIGSTSFQTKSRKQRVVPMHTRVKEILLVRSKKLEVRGKPTPSVPLPGGDKSVAIFKLTGSDKNRKDYVFCKSNGYPFTGDYFSKQFKKACRKAGLSEELHFHCLRHGAATRMISNGAPLPSVQRILGHANIQTTMIYTHPDIEDLRAAVNRL